MMRRRSTAVGACAMLPPYFMAAAGYGTALSPAGAACPTPPPCFTGSVCRPDRLQQRCLPRCCLSQGSTSHSKQHAPDGAEHCCRYLARPGPSLAQGTAAVAASIWHDDPDRLRALEATGLVPEKGVMWGHVDVQPEMVRTLGVVGMVSGIGDVEDVPGPAARGAAAAPTWAAVHSDACARGDKFYEDPESRLMVMTEVVHKERGQCCGRACRHCPYMHERVAMHVRPEMIARAAWLEKPGEGVRRGGGSGAGSSHVHVWVCGGTEADVAYAAEVRAAGGEAVLVVPLDAESRCVQATGVHAVDAKETARVSAVPLVGLPVHRCGPGLDQLAADAVAVVEGEYGGAAASWEVSGSLGETMSDWGAALKGVLS